MFLYAALSIIQRAWREYQQIEHLAVGETRNGQAMNRRTQKAQSRIWIMRICLLTVLFANGEALADVHALNDFQQPQHTHLNPLQQVEAISLGEWDIDHSCFHCYHIHLLALSSLAETLEVFAGVVPPPEYSGRQVFFFSTPPTPPPTN